MKLKFNKKIIAFAVLVLMTFNAGVAYAVETPSELDTMKQTLLANLPKAALANCKDALVPIYDIEIIKFFAFVDENFKNKSEVSTLVNIAVARYSTFKKSLSDTYAALTPQYDPGAELQVHEGQIEAYALCGEITNSYAELAKEHLKKHIKKNVADKKTTKLLEKYKSINEKLRDLNIKVSEMYSLFLTFTNKLPFFVKNCQTK